MSGSHIDIHLKERGRLLHLMARASSEEQIMAIDYGLAQVYRKLGEAYFMESGMIPTERFSKAVYYFQMSIDTYQQYPNLDVEDEIAEIYELKAQIFENLGATGLGENKGQSFYKGAESSLQSAIRHAKTRKSYYEAKLDQLRLRRRLP